MTNSSKGSYSRGFTFLFLFSLAVASVSSERCVYTIFVKTGTDKSAATDSKISCTLKDGYGWRVDIPNLEQYGRMGSGHDYFEIGNLDVFTVETTCSPSPVCHLTLTSDGSGQYPSWYVDYFQVLTTRDHENFGDNVIFSVYGWLSLDLPPHSLTRVFNKCSSVVLQQNSII